MKIPFQSLAILVAASLLMLVQFQNCSSYNDPSLFEYSAGSSSLTSSPSDIRLDSPNGVIDVGQDEKALSVGGECNVGLKKKHYIEVQMKNEQNSLLPVKEDSLCPERGQGLSAECYRAIQFRCEHGRYYVHLPLNCSHYMGQPRSLYRLTGQLVIVDEATGKETRDIKATFDRFFQMAWAASACQ